MSGKERESGMRGKGLKGKWNAKAGKERKGRGKWERKVEWNEGKGRER